MENTKIEWATHTFNPWEGCTKVGPGCNNCYAETRNARFSGGTSINWGPGAPRRRTSEKNWQLPLKWNREAEKTGVRPRVFCSSLADVFDNEVDPQWLVDLFDLIQSTPRLDWLLLTKRIGNAATMVKEGRWFPSHWPNVWIGATIVNQDEADRDIPKLLAVPSAKRFLSMEPLLGPVDLSYFLEGWMCRKCGVSRIPMGDHGNCDCPLPGDTSEKQGDHKNGMLDWVIVGGESGPKARPMHPQWARSLRDQCQAAGVPFLFKQWGEWRPRDDWSFHVPMRKHCAIKLDGSAVSNDDAPQDVGGHRFELVGKKAAGRLLDGRTWDEAPA